MKSDMSDLRFFDLLQLNWMESPKIFVRKRKNGRFLPKIEKRPNFGTFDQNVNFLTTYGHKIKNLASSVKF